MRGMDRRSIVRTAAGASAAILLLSWSWPAAGQQGPLTLGDALARADRGAYANRMAEGERRTQAGEGLRALQGILPTVRLEGGYGRTTDPIGAFGITLRQRSITQQDFDPALLNHPDATVNYTGAVVVEQPLVNADAWLGRRAATHATAARAAAARWTSVQTRVDVVGAYFGSVLAHAQVRTLEEAHEAARGHVRQAESMAEQGMVTRSDALLAQVKAGEIETQLIEARGAASLVKRQLAMLLGAPADTSFALPAELPAAKRVFALNESVIPTPAETMSEAVAPESRGDVQAALSAHAAARTDVRRARSVWLPRLNGMARYDWNSPDAPFGGQENWSIGVVASWTPFAGASQVAGVRAAAGREEVARAQAEAARAQAELDVASRSNAWTVALERLRIAGDAVAQSVEAHRIVTRKYEGGLATVVELLAASAAETEARLREAHARYEAVVRGAELLRSVGRDPALLADWAVDS
ncbi:MAG TPA: TolC family protein [Longimicrobiales bacterium]